MNEQGYKAAVSKLIQKTYDEHGVEGHPWGWDAKRNMCSYKKGCAIGVSLTEEVAGRLDYASGEGGSFNTNSALERPEVRQELLGDEGEPPHWVYAALTSIQEQHDFIASRPDRRDSPAWRTTYRAELVRIAGKYELTLVTAEGQA